MKRKYKSLLKIVFLLTLLVLYLLNSTLIIKTTINYTKLFITKLFPVTFIIYIISSLLIDQGIINYLSPTAYVIVMSLISGFPSGSKNTHDLLNKNYLTSKEANYLIRFTHFPNPLFILGSIKDLFNNNYPILILTSLILSNFIISIIYKQKDNSKKNYHQINSNFSKSLSTSINSSLKVLINIYGTSIFFILIIEIITKHFILNPKLYVLLSGLFDLTKGTFSTAIIKNKSLRAIFIIIFNSLGSIPIHIQIKNIITDTNIKYRNFLTGRILQLIISIIIFIFLITIRSNYINSVSITKILILQGYMNT